MTFAEYRAIEAMNWSSLKLMDNPRLYQWRQEHPQPERAALSLGSAVHCAVLEPDDFDARYVIRPEGIDLRTKAGRAWRSDVCNGRSMVSETVALCRDSVMANPEARELVESATTEQTATWTDTTGVECKARLDALCTNEFSDIKTTSKPLDQFEREVARHMYHGQIAFYGDGAHAAGMTSSTLASYIIAVETVEPYDCAVFRLPPHIVEAGRRLYRSFLDNWLTCRETGLWPGRYPGMNWLDLPPWAPGMESES